MNHINFKEGVLIFGFPRSGTTLARKTFAKNSNYFVYEIELQWLVAYFLKFGKSGIDKIEAWNFLSNHNKFPSNNRWKSLNINKTDFLKYFNEFEQVSIKELFRGVMNLIFSNEKDYSNKKLVVKYPQLIEHEEVVRILFEKVLIINMVRDPRAAVSSHMNRWPSKELNYVTKLYNKSIDKISDFGNYNLINIKFEDFISISSIIEKELRIFLNDSNFRIDNELENETLQFSSNSKGIKQTTKLKGFQKAKINNFQSDLKLQQIAFIEMECKKSMNEYNYEFLNTKRNIFFYYSIKIEHFIATQKRKLAIFLRKL